MLKYGDNNIGKVYLGSNPIGKAYYGSDLVFQKGSSPTPPQHKVIYQLPGTKTSTFDTGIKLFDTPKSFTIYFDAKFTNYNWANDQRLIGLDSTTLFGFGKISSGNDYQSGTLNGTGNRYTALIMNTMTTENNCSSILPRTNSSIRHKIAITYDASTRKISAFASNTNSFGHWYTLSSPLVSDLTLKLIIGTTTSTIYDMKIYNYCMTDEEVDSLIGVISSE